MCIPFLPRWKKPESPLDQIGQLNTRMDTIKEYLSIAVKSNLLWEVMEWDLKHGPTPEQYLAFEVLFGHMELDKITPDWAHEDYPSKELWE